MSIKWLRMPLLALAGLCLVRALSASAQVSLGLGEVLDAVKGDPELVRQIEVELRKQDLKVPGIGCIAAAHGSEWRLLAGGRAAPYECRIGERVLRIEAMRTYFDIGGRRLGQPGQVTPELLLNRARYFREGNFQWTWSP
jgi:hypothetical protein